jgi:hypothetical protein
VKAVFRIYNDFSCFHVLLSSDKYKSIMMDKVG